MLRLREKDDRVFFGPMGLHACTADLMERIAATSSIKGIARQTHVAEGKAFASSFLAMTGRTEVAELHAARFLGPACSLVHCTHILADDVKRIADTGTTVVLCPSEWCPSAADSARQLIAARVNVALGTDSSRSCSGLRAGALMMANELSGWLEDAHALVLRAATAGGARALQAGTLVGSLEPGKTARFLAVGISGDAPPCQALLAGPIVGALPREQMLRA